MALPSPKALLESRPFTTVRCANGIVRSNSWYSTFREDSPALSAYVEAEAAFYRASLDERLVTVLEEELHAHVPLSLTLPSVAISIDTVGWKEFGQGDGVRGELPRYMASVNGGPSFVLLDLNEEMGRAPDRHGLHAGPPTKKRRGRHGESQPPVMAGYKSVGVGFIALSPDGTTVAVALDSVGDEFFALELRAMPSGEVIVRFEPEVARAFYHGVWSLDSTRLYFVQREPLAKGGRASSITVLVLGDDGSWSLEEEPMFVEDDDRFSLEARLAASGDRVIVDAISTTEIRASSFPRVGGKVTPCTPRTWANAHATADFADSWLVLVRDEATPGGRVVRFAEDSLDGNEEVLFTAAPDVYAEDMYVLSTLHAVVKTFERGLPAFFVIELQQSEAEPTRVSPAHFFNEGQPFFAKLYDVSAFTGTYSEPTSVLSLSIESLTQPSRVVEYDIRAGTWTVTHKRHVPFYAPKLYTEQRWSTPESGIPISIAFKADAEDDGEPMPVLLDMYGAYGSPSDVTFRGAFSRPLLDAGVAIGIVHVHGGCELGHDWVTGGQGSAGTRRVMDDVLEALRYLVDERKFTTYDRVILRGRSAGGLTVLGAAHLSPQPLCAVIGLVPAVDALTSLLDPSCPLTSEELEEFGDPDNSVEDYNTLSECVPAEVAWRPEAASRWPSLVLLTSSHNDSRVVYGEPLAFAAGLRTTAPNTKVMLKMEDPSSGVGHFPPVGRKDLVRYSAEQLAVILRALDMAVPRRRGKLVRSGSQVSLTPLPWPDVTVLLPDPAHPLTWTPDDHDECIGLLSALAESPVVSSVHRLTDHTTLRALPDASPTFYFNLLQEGLDNDAALEMHVPALLDLKRLRYTGSTAATIAVTLDKSAMRGVLVSGGVPVPWETRCLRPSDVDWSTVSLPLVCKLADGFSSEGIIAGCIAHTLDDAKAALDRLIAAKPGRTYLLQEFLSGREFSVGVIGNLVCGDFEMFPIIEVDYSGCKSFDCVQLEDRRGDPEGSEYWTQVREVVSPKLTPELDEQLHAYTERAFVLLGMADYGRFDFRCDAAGVPKLMDSNPNNWLGGKYTKQALAAGYTKTTMMEKIVRTAQERYRRKEERP